MKQPIFLLTLCLVVGLQNQQANAQNDASTPEVQAASTESSEQVQEEGLRMNFRNVPLEMVLDYMSEAAGFSIIAETDISGEVSVWNNRPLNKEQAVSLLDSILNEKGYAAIRVGNTLKIVSSGNAITENIPVRTGNDPAAIPQSDRMVTQIIPVRYTGAKDLIENLEPLLPENASMTANESSNAVVLTGTENNIRRVAEIIRALDTSISGISQLKVFSLKYSDATELADVVKSLFYSSRNSHCFVTDGGDFRGDDHFHHSILGNERCYPQNDTNVPIHNGVYLLSTLKKIHIINERYFLAHGDNRFLIVASKNRWTRKHFQFPGFSNCPQCHVEIIVKQLVNPPLPLTLRCHAKDRLHDVGCRARNICPTTFDTNVQIISMCHFHEDHFNEHLRLGTVECFEDVPDLKAGFFICDHDHRSCFRIHLDQCIANLSIVQILAGRLPTQSSTSAYLGTQFPL
ncbi:hypothetical protein OAG43_05160 [Verrucomicrobia bacterium]|nr:hypothetical protein [Verrucomicrobiota bacterium]